MSEESGRKRPESGGKRPGSGGKQPEPGAKLPISVRAVAIVLAVAGAMYVILGLAGVSASDRSDALYAIGAMVLGAGCLFVGWQLLRGVRWAYFATIVVLCLAIVGGAVTAFTASDRAVLAQLFVPAIGLYLLGRRESRDHFLV